MRWGVLETGMLLVAVGVWAHYSLPTAMIVGGSLIIVLQVTLGVLAKR
jgi:hypothetical protein